MFDCVTKIAVVLSTILDCSFKYSFEICVLFIWPALQYSILKCYPALLFSFFFWEAAIHNLTDAYKDIKIYNICPCILETFFVLAAVVQCATSEIFIPQRERTLYSMWLKHLHLLKRQC